MAGRNDSLVANNVLVGTLSAGDSGMSGIIGTAYDPTYAIVSEAGSQIVLYINSSDYKFYAQLRDKNSNVIYTSNIIDLPLETMVVNGRYDSETKCVILTLDNGNEISFSVADLVSGLVSTTDYASSNIAGVIKIGSAQGTTVTSGGTLRAIAKTYADYNSGEDYLFVGKGTLENVITGKGLVSNTDYATDSVGGVFKTGTYGTQISSGHLSAKAITYSAYSSANNNLFVSKGTLENVITGKDLTTKAYVDGLVGNIDSALDAINGEVIS